MPLFCPGGPSCFHPARQENEMAGSPSTEVNEIKEDYHEEDRHKNCQPSCDQKTNQPRKVIR